MIGEYFVPLLSNDEQAFKIRTMIADYFLNISTIDILKCVIIQPYQCF